jgi:hypothetical protein
MPNLVKTTLERVWGKLNIDITFLHNSFAMDFHSNVIVLFPVHLNNSRCCLTHIKLSSAWIALFVHVCSLCEYSDRIGDTVITINSISIISSMLV